MDQLIYTSFLGLLAGVVGTGLGGLVVFLIKEPTKGLMGSLLGFSGGIMLAIVFLDLIPESILLGNLQFAMLGLGIGIMMIAMVDAALSIKKDSAFTEDREFLKSGILLTVGIAMHNFPEGLAIGSGYTAVQNLGVSLAVLFLIHNMPEGMAMTAPFKAGNMKNSRILSCAALAGVPMGIGAFMGNFLGGVSSYLISLCMAFAGGAMLYITVSELLPKAQGLARKNSYSYSVILGIVLGLILCYLL